MIVASFDGSAAADVTSAAKSGTAEPVSLAGRWSGERYGYGRGQAEGDCGSGSGCVLTFDVVACKDGWCGIAVKDGGTCGAVGLHLSAAGLPDATGRAFKGDLTLAKGSAAYVVDARYGSDDGPAQLHLVGDTGSSLRIMRRSFPLEANLARTGDATCTLDKATS